MRAATIAAAALALAACKIDSTTYVAPGGDGGDDDAAAIDAGGDAPDGIHVVVTPSTTTVSEGGQVTLQVELSEAPPADRTIDIVGTALLTPTPAQLTFTAANWNVGRTVILAAGQDDDADDSPVTVLFNGNGQVADAAAMVMITDDDALTLVVTPPSSLSVTEGATGQVQVQLSARPSSSVVVAVASDDGAVATAAPAQLTFTSSNWSTPQLVTVTGVDDADTANATALLVLDAATEGVPTVNLAVNVTDNDVVAIDASPSNLGTIDEPSGQATLGVRLTQAPIGTVTVDLTAIPGAAVTLNPSQLTFTTLDYATVQNVTVRAVDDVNDVDEQVSIQLSATGLADRLVQATIRDDDTQAIVVAPVTVPTLDEGQSRPLQVTLAYQPAGTVIVDVASNDPALASVDVAQLTFNPTTYATAQVVNVTAVQDANLADGSTTVSFNAAALGLTTSRTITVNDDDTQSIAVSAGAIAVGEGQQATFTARLQFQPAADVTVGVAVGSGNGGDIAAGPASLTFTPGNYATPQVVTVSGLQDGDATNETAAVVLSTTGASDRTVTVNVADDDSVDIVVSPGAIAVTEGGAGQTLMVSLGAMPAANVTVNLVTSPTGVAQLAVASLSFTPVNYATPQGVLVTGLQDGDALDETTTISLTAVGLAEKTVPVSVTDDDVVTPVLSANPVSITEGIPDDSLAVALSRDPGRAVTVEVPAFGFTDLEVSPTFFTFDSSNWDQPQRFSLFARADDTADPETETVLFQIAGEGQASLMVNIADPTILVGFPPPHGGAGSGVIGLRAFRDGAIPSCWVIEKIAIDVAAAPSTSSQLALAVYSDGGSAPKSRVWQSFALTLGQGAGLRIIDIPDETVYSPTSMQVWVAVEATTGVGIRTQAASVDHCARAHPFGDPMPDPFDHDGVVIGGGSGSGSSDGGVAVSCAPQPPVAVWLIGHEEETCFIPL